MLSREELGDYMMQLEYARDNIDKQQILQSIYRKGYVAGCNDSGNPVKE